MYTVVGCLTRVLGDLAEPVAASAAYSVKHNDGNSNHTHSDSVDNDRFRFQKRVLLAPEGKDCLFSESGKTSSDTEYEGQDSKGGVDRYQGSAESSGAFIANQQ